MQDYLVIRPQGIYLSGVPGIGNYYLGTMTVARGMQDSFSVHLGGEWEAVERRLYVRAGYLYESSATPDAYANVLTPDGQKNMVTAGLGVKLGKVRLDAGYGHIFYPDRTVTNSNTGQLNPIQPNLLVPVGNGRYTIDADVVSLGLETRF
jgi:long-subunit fatty acid transport protein